MDHYPTRFTDGRGGEDTFIVNDGKWLRMRLRGVNLEGQDFDALTPVEGTAPERLAQLPLHRGDLCSCRLEWRMSLPVQERGVSSAGMLSVELILGDPAANGGLDREELRLVLEHGGARYAATGSGWFEDDLLGIQSQLPEGVFLKACINCLYSDYSPLGHGLFGGMMCFGDRKEEYLRVRTKRDLFALGAPSKFVQETHLCPEFQRRVPGTGYRG